MRSRSSDCDMTSKISVLFIPRVEVPSGSDSECTSAVAMARSDGHRAVDQRAQECRARAVLGDTQRIVGASEGDTV